MDINFDISSCNQIEKYANKIKAKLYKKIYEDSKKTQWIRLAGLPIGVTAAFITIATRVSLIGENFFKGVANIFGFLFVKDCHLVNGLRQIFLVPVHVIVLPFSLGKAIFEIFAVTLGITLFPEIVSHELWLLNDPVENFKALRQEVRDTPENSRNWKSLAKCYKEGKGTPVDREKAKICLRNAAKIDKKILRSEMISFEKLDSDSQDEISPEEKKKLMDETDHFGKYFEMTQNEPDNIEAWQELEKCYRNGIGTVEEPNKADECSQKIRDLSMKSTMDK